MSAGTFTDENGQMYVVTPEGKLIPKGPRKSGSLADQAKAQGLKQAGKLAENVAVKVAKQIPGAIGLNGLVSGVTDTTAPATGAMSGLTTSSTLSPPNILAVRPAPVEPGMFDLSGIGSAGNAILPAAGLAGAYDLYANRPQNIGTGKGYLEGGLAGAGIGSFFGPVGAGVGAGLGLLANAFGIGHESRTKGEEKARAALAEQGINVPNADIKEWENNQKFAQSRNEADLTGKDIMHAASLYGMSGYAGLDPSKQEAIANEALKQGLVREHHGQIDIGMNDAYQKFIESQMGGGGGTSRSQSVQEDPRAQRARKAQAIAQIIPELESTPTKAPRYDINLSSLMTNPYL